MKYCIYVLRSLTDSSIYIGMTNDLSRRIKQHKLGQVRSTKSKRPFKLIYKELLKSRSEARSREKYFKTGFGRELIKTSFI